MHRRSPGGQPAAPLPSTQPALPSAKPKGEGTTLGLYRLVRKGETDPLLKTVDDAFRQVADAYPTSPYAPLALLRAGDANLRMWRRPELDPTPGQDALAIYQELAGRFPGTDAAGRAQVHVRQLKDQFAEKAYKNGMFYLKRGAYDSAIIYFKDVIASYPEASRTVDALFRLAEIYRTIRYTDEFKETCDHLQRYYPRARGLAVLCPAPTTSAATP